MVPQPSQKCRQCDGDCCIYCGYTGWERPLREWPPLSGGARRRHDKEGSLRTGVNTTPLRQDHVQPLRRTLMPEAG